MLPGRPTLDCTRAEEIVRSLYGLEVRAEPLPSERDQNFLLRVGARPAFVWKVANAAEHREALESQQSLLARLAQADPELAAGLPVVREASDGSTLALIQGEGGSRHWSYLVTWVTGRRLAELRPRKPPLLESLGAWLGRFAHATADFRPVWKPEAFHWDLRRAGATIRELLPHVQDEARRGLLLAVVEAFETDVVPRISSLSPGFLHNDANEDNVLVEPLGGDPRRAWDCVVRTVLDFGDALPGPRVFDPAIAAAYASLGERDPLAAAAHVVAGYQRTCPLPEDELAVLFPALRARLALSVATSARARSLEPQNAYLTTSESAAWRTLEVLDDVHPHLALAHFRRAVGLEPCPRNHALVAWANDRRGAFAPVLGPDLARGPFASIDLSVAGEDTLLAAEPDDAEAWTAAFRSKLSKLGARYGVGRYAEPRLAYVGDQFVTSSSERRTIHLGLDLFCEAGTAVYAPLDGRVYGFGVNALPGDYGPTILLEHATDAGLSFLTLYGHLSKDSLDGWSVGAPVRKGERIAALGSSDENGGWPPHLHFQVMTHPLGRTTDYPGVAAPSAEAVWRSLCPDPEVFAGMGELPRMPEALGSADLRSKRRAHLGPSLSVSYREPLHIVRGKRRFLFDECGRTYLDGVNNVAHVGHSHPRVAAALAKQSALLNTNTRYLHPAILEYAERLTALLPGELDVCFFVCSGSEANELALRLARTYTGRRDVIVLDAAYHGNTSALIELSPYKHSGPGGAGTSEHVHVAPMPDVYRGSFRGPDAGARYSDAVRDMIRGMTERGRPPAAMFCESLLSCGGQIVPPAGYLRSAFGHVRAAGGVCIADEVQVGFGRVGSHYWAFDMQGATPDIVTLGKPIGNGHPLGAVVTTRAIADAFANGMEYFNTFGGNPVSCAVGLAVLDVIEEESLQRNAARIGEHMLAKLRALAERHPLVGDVRGAGLFLGVELVLDRETREPAPHHASYVVERMKEEGILLSTDGPAHNVLKIKPPLVFTMADADCLTTALDAVLAEPALRVTEPPR